MVWFGDFFNIPNKAWEFQIEKWPEWIEYINLCFSWTRNCDHAGLRITIEICGYFAEFQIYDTRHWDHEKKTWCVYKEDDDG